MQFLFRIQFSWRIMMITTVLLSASCGIYVCCLTDKFLSAMTEKIQLLPLFVFCAVCGFPILIESLTNRAYSMDFFRYTERNNFLSGSEYMPVKLKREMIEKTGDHVISDDPDFEMTSFVRKGLSVTWDYQLPEGKNDVTMLVPLIYYTGYHGFRIKPGEEAGEIPISKNEVGLITVTNDDIPAGQLSVRYVKTAMQHLGDTISLVTLLSCILFLSRRKQKHTANPEKSL